MLPVGHPFLYQPIDRVEDRFSIAEKIGIACGNVSGGFYCIDFDGHNGEDIESIFVEYFDNPSVQYLINQDLISVFKTPSGGFHIYFRYDDELKGTCFARYKSGDVMIEMRGHGQYVAVYPSQGYEYVAGTELVKLSFIDKDTYTWLIELAKSFNQQPEIVKTDLNGNSRKWPDRWDDAKVDGNFNNTQGEYAKELLKEVGWKLITIRKNDGVELWQRPGKALEDGVSATFGVKFNMFYNFSQSATPFEVRAYSPFDIYTLLKYGGDWKQAKDSLKPTIVEDAQPEPDHNYFPIEVFPDFLQKYILELRRTLNFHPDFTAASVMFAIASINGNKYKLKVKEGWEASTIFWFACVGFPGTIKTHPVKVMINPIYSLDRESKEMYDDEMLHYDPDAKPRQPKPKFRQILISDYTIEALHSIHNINKRGIGLYKDELVGFLNDMNKYRKGSDEQFWLESFNNGTYIVNRVTKEPIMIDNICINMIGTIQNDVLNKVISDNKGNGLIDRFLFTSSESKVYQLNNEDVDVYYRQQWSQVVQKMNKYFIYHSDKDTEMVKMTDEAFRVYQQIDERYVAIQNSDDENQDIKNYLSKMKTYVPRFALLLSIIESVFDDSYITVTDRHMLNAGKIADYFIGTATKVFASNSLNRDINDVAVNMKGLKRDDKVHKLHDKGFKPNEIATYFNMSRVHVYRILKRVVT